MNVRVLLECHHHQHLRTLLWLQEFISKTKWRLWGRARHNSLLLGSSHVTHALHSCMGRQALKEKDNKKTALWWWWGQSWQEMNTCLTCVTHDIIMKLVIDTHGIVVRYALKVTVQKKKSFESIFVLCTIYVNPQHIFLIICKRNANKKTLNTISSFVTFFWQEDYFNRTTKQK